ncbi:hypothetical protein D3C86_2168130 [compost metagenome]
MLAYDKAVNERADRFEVVAGDAVVADERIRHRDDLTAVGRVGQYFLITGHPGVEHDFAGRFAFAAERLADKQRAVFQ